MNVQMALTNCAGISTFAALWGFACSNALGRFRAGSFRASTGILFLAFLCLSGAVVARGVEAQRFPLANLYESILWFAWAIQGAYLYFQRKYELGNFGWAVCLIAGCMFIYGSWLPAGQHEIQPLMPALVSYWRQIHVPPLLFSYALFFLAGCLSLGQLWASGHLRSFLICVGSLCTGGLAVALGTFTSVETWLLQAMFVGGVALGVFFAWANLPGINVLKVQPSRAQVYDDAAQRAIMVGFPLLTFGVITGGLWANHAWGSYWSWDPKESMALATWLGYAAYIHLRVHKELAPEKLSVVAVGAMLITMLTYLGFNSLGFGGLHSYGRFK